MLKELSKVKKIIETSDTKEANELLEQGWEIIDTYTTTFSAESSDQVIMYVLVKSEE